jgi:hypothetical protein
LFGKRPPFPKAPHSPKHGTVFFGSRYGAAATSAGLKKYNSLIPILPLPLLTATFTHSKKAEKKFLTMRVLWSFKRKSGPRKPEGSQAWISAPDVAEETLGNVVLWGRGGCLPNGTLDNKKYKRFLRLVKS